MRSVILSLILLLCFGCSHDDHAITVSIGKTGSSSIAINGFDKAIIDDIDRDTTAGIWQSLLPVYKMPADTDMKDFQQAQPGKYHVEGSTVVFTPDTPFSKGKVYFLRCFDRAGVKSAWQLVRSGKRPGTSKYKDVLFGY